MRYDLLDVPSCNMCGSSDRRQLGLRLNGTTGLRPRRASGAAVPVMQCRKCGLIYSDPLPKPLSIDDHYEMDAEDYFDGLSAAEVDPFDNRELDDVIDIRPGMKVLDIGAGFGAAMIGFEKAGWEAWGVEPSKAFVKWGVENVGMSRERLIEGTFEDADLPAGHFDMVSFNSVLEHLLSPSDALAKACRLLKPGGIIRAGVPSASFLLSRLINLYYRVNATPYVTNISPMHPPFHLYEFTRKSFVENGRRVGYQIERHRHMVMTLYNVPVFAEAVVRRTLERTSKGDGLSVILRSVAKG